MRSAGVFVSPEAFEKIIFHSAKFPYNSVLGILAGTLPSGNESTGFLISHAFPVFHNWTSLTPMLEIALDQIRMHLKKLPENVAILGFYHGSERLAPYVDISSSKSPISLPISVQLEEMIRLKLPTNFKPIAINVNPNSLTLAEAKNPLECFFYNQASKQWQDHPLAVKSKDEASRVASLADPSIIVSTLEALSLQQVPSNLYDFDDHLQNPSCNWIQIE